MNPPSQRQLLGIMTLLLVAAGVAQAWPGVLLQAGIVAGAGSVLLWAAGGASGGGSVALEPVREAIRRLKEGRRPEAPADSPPEMRRIYAELDEVAETVSELRENEARRRREIDQAARAVGDL